MKEFGPVKGCGAVKGSTGCLCVVLFVVVGWFVGASGKSAVVGINVESALALVWRGKGCARWMVAPQFWMLARGSASAGETGGWSAIAIAVATSTSDSWSGCTSTGYWA